MIKKIQNYIGNYILKKNKDELNLQGDRDIEWSFVAAYCPEGPGYALDFGTGGSSLGLIAARKKFQVTSIDLGKVEWPYINPHLEFIQGDLLEMSFQQKEFDIIINCSTIEHVGLQGRYNIFHNKPDGDIEAMQYMKNILKDNGHMLITIPVGIDAIFKPLHRVYGLERLPKLFYGYSIQYEEFWVKNSDNKWIMTDKNDALLRETQPYLYGLGCFILRNI